MENLDNQTGFWDKVAEGKSFTHPFDFRRFEKHVSKHQPILDYGCGYGRTCSALWDRGYTHVTGTDISAQMIRRGRQTHPHLNLMVMAGQRIPFKDRTFGAVVLFAVLTCIPTDEGQVACISEIERVLCPGGLIYVSDYWLQKDARNINRYETCRNRFNAYGIFQVPEGAFFRHHDRRWIDALLSGFKKIERFDVSVLTMNGNQADAFQYLGKK